MSEYEDVLDFNKDIKKVIDVIPELEDGYLHMTALNALRENGFDISTEGLKQFQKSIDLEPTGVLDLVTFNSLIMVFDAIETQDILMYLRERLKSYDKEQKANRRKEKRYDFLASCLAIMFFIFLVIGIFTTFSWFVDWIKNLVV